VTFAKKANSRFGEPAFVDYVDLPRADLEWYDVISPVTEVQHEGIGSVAWGRANEPPRNPDPASSAAAAEERGRRCGAIAWAWLAAERQAIDGEAWS